MEIITNHTPRPLLSRYEVPAKVLEDQFDYLPDEVSGFFKYKSNWYHLADFMKFHEPHHLWHGYAGDSYFSGVLIQCTNDCESVIVGRYYQ